MRPTENDVHRMAFVRGYVLRRYSRRGYAVDHESGYGQGYVFFTLIETARWLAGNWPAVRPYRLSQKTTA